MASISFWRSISPVSSSAPGLHMGSNSSGVVGCSAGVVGGLLDDVVIGLLVVMV